MSRPPASSSPPSPSGSPPDDAGDLDILRPPGRPDGGGAEPGGEARTLLSSVFANLAKGEAGTVASYHQSVSQALAAKSQALNPAPPAKARKAKRRRGGDVRPPTRGYARCRPTPRPWRPSTG